MRHGEHVPQPSTFTNGWARGYREYNKQETDLTELTITKALTKTTNCTCRTKKVEGHDKKISGALPHFQI